jgi:hypothetical protein
MEIERNKVAFAGLIPWLLDFFSFFATIYSSQRGKSQFFWFYMEVTSKCIVISKHNLKLPQAVVNSISTSN